MALLWTAGGVFAQQGEQICELLLKLGVPGAAGAKWVKVQAQYGGHEFPLLPMIRTAGESEEPEIPGLGSNKNTQYSGNAWQFETKDKSLDLIQNFTTRKKVTEEGIGVTQANLDADVNLLLKALAAPRNNEHRSYGEAPLNTQAACVLLLAAQLHSNGRKSDAAKLATAALAFAESPNAAIDSAVTLLAESRLAKINESWIQGGEIAGYVKQLEALRKEFDQGWANASAIPVLIERAKTPQKVTGELASILSKLTLEQMQFAIRGNNWLLESFDPEAGKKNRGWGRRRVAAGRKTATAGSDEDVLIEFLKKGIPAAEALAELLDERTLIRIPRNGPEDFGDIQAAQYFDENPVMDPYSTIPRPMEMGELAMAILRPVLPGYHYDSEGASPEKAKAWVKQLHSMDGEKVMWSYVSGPGQGYNTQRSVALSYLVRNGGEQTLEKLGKYFLNPDVWNQNPDEIIEQVMAYVERAKSSDEYKKQVRNVARASAESRFAINDEFMANDGDYKAQIEAQKRGAIKQAEALFAPPSIYGPFEEFVEKEGVAPDVLYGEIQQLVKPHEANIVQALKASVAAKDSNVKMSLIQSVAMWCGVWADDERAFPPAELLKSPEAVAALKALMTLPVDESEATVPGRSLAEVVGLLVMKGSLGKEESDKYQTLHVLPAKWRKAFESKVVEAVLAGEKIPEIPTAAKMQDDELTKLIAELEQLPTTNIPEVLESKDPGLQLALFAKFATLPKLPERILEAAWTIHAEPQKETSIKPEQWNGKKVSVELFREITGVVRASLEQGATTMIILQREGLALRLRATSGDKREVVKNSLKHMFSDLPNDPKGVVWVNAGNASIAYPILETAGATEEWLRQRENREGGNPQRRMFGNVSQKTFEEILQQSIAQTPKWDLPMAMAWSGQLVKTE